MKLCKYICYGAVNYTFAVLASKVLCDDGKTRSVTE